MLNFTQLHRFLKREPKAEFLWLHLTPISACINTCIYTWAFLLWKSSTFCIRYFGSHLRKQQPKSIFCWWIPFKSQKLCIIQRNSIPTTTFPYGLLCDFLFIIYMCKTTLAEILKECSRVKSICEGKYLINFNIFDALDLCLCGIMLDRVSLWVCIFYSGRNFDNIS